MSNATTFIAKDAITASPIFEQIKNHKTDAAKASRLELRQIVKVMSNFENEARVLSSLRADATTAEISLMAATLDYEATAHLARTVDAMIARQNELDEATAQFRAAESAYTTRRQLAVSLFGEGLVSRVA